MVAELSSQVDSDIQLAMLNSILITCGICFLVVLSLHAFFGSMWHIADDHAYFIAALFFAAPFFIGLQSKL